ncbi:hypothetical protein [Caloramator australicus]|uniref:Uncharacterized protein n=1 Tax=Caloramator australicus RC3 TaxID=857293 RepID=I7LG70_9CLOT|nr:hypothetical protein [Caloramator australicus]CCJ33050.1 hypothetical protein CAAU_0966 [Caloramator australicus RC3]
MERRLKVVRELNKHYAVIRTDILETSLSMESKVLYFVLSIAADQGRDVNDDMLKELTSIKTDEILYQALDELAINGLVKYNKLTGIIELID